MVHIAWAKMPMNVIFFNLLIFGYEVGYDQLAVISPILKGLNSL